MHLANDPYPAPSPAPFWAVLREYLRQAFSMFGAPADIAKQLWLTREQHKLLSGWLRLLEQMLRRLVFIDALALALEPAPAPAESKFRRRLAMEANTGAHFDCEHSDTWRASFALDRRHVIPGRRAAANPEPAGKRQCRQGDPWRALPNARAATPLALRLEALVRGFNNPEHLAARCARLIARTRARALAFLVRVRARDRYKPGFDQLAELVELTIAHFQNFLAAACDTS